MEDLEEDTRSVNDGAESGTRMSVPQCRHLTATLFCQEALDFYKHVFVEAGGNSQGKVE